MSTSLFPFLCIAVCLGACHPAPAPSSATSAGGGSSSGSGASGNLASLASSGGSCPVLPAGATGLVHSGAINADETWRASDSPHRVTSDLTIYGSVTIEKCATVVLGHGVIIDVGSGSAGGTLRALGNYQAASGANAEIVEPVVFTSAVSGEYWGGIVVAPAASAEFNTTVLAHGGDIAAVNNGAATLLARGPNDGTMAANIKASLLVVLQSGGFGIAMQNGAGFAPAASGSGGIAVLGSGTQTVPLDWNQDYQPSYPLAISPPGISTIPEGIYRGTVAADLTYGNTHASNDKILLLPSRAITVDESFHVRGVPYLMQYSFDMQPPALATLTIDAGVEIRFRADPSGAHNVRMSLGDEAGASHVKLVAAGTAANPIVLTSDATAPAAGDWVGLVLNGQPASGNTLSNARIAFAGGNSTTNSFGCGPGDNDSAILIMQWRPDDAFIQAVQISQSAGGGIVCGWASDLAGPDLKTPNTFADIANGCDVAKWRTAAGANYCPGRTDASPLCL